LSDVSEEGEEEDGGGEIIFHFHDFTFIVWQIPEKVDIVISTVTRETIASTVEPSNS
jgi:hypothetical protein